MNHPHIAARVFNTPLLVEPRKAGAFLRGLGPRLLGGTVKPMGFEELPVVAPLVRATTGDGDEPGPSLPPYASLLGDELAAELRRGEWRGCAVVEGVAVVPVSGVLVHRGGWIGKSSGQTSYEGLWAQIDAAAADPTARAIALEIDSFGGEVAGCFDLADHIRAVGRRKPVRAFVAEHALSAAYALASSGDQIIMPRTGRVGSIGVVCMHVDISRALDADGIGVTLIHSGRHKADGNPYEPLPDAVRGEFQREMEELRQLFARTVALGRGNRLGLDAALATEARCLGAEAAVQAGLADAIGEPRAGFQAFIEELNQATTVARNGGKSMGKRMAAQLSHRRAAEEEPEEEQKLQEEEPEEEEDEEAPDEDSETSPEDLQDGEDEEEEDEEEAPEGAGAKAGAAQERRRIAAILHSPQAQGRMSLAQHLAFRTRMTPKAAIALLKAAPAARGGLAQAMRQGPEGRVGLGGPGQGPAISAAALMRARFGQAKG